MTTHPYSPATFDAHGIGITHDGNVVIDMRDGTITQLTRDHLVTIVRDHYSLEQNVRDLRATVDRLTTSHFIPSLVSRLKARAAFSETSGALGQAGAYNDAATMAGEGAL